MIDEVKKTIQAYLARQVDVDDLGLLLPDGWELDRSGDVKAQTMTLYAIGYLAEYQRGDRTEEKLREALAQLVA